MQISYNVSYQQAFSWGWTYVYLSQTLYVCTEKGIGTPTLHSQATVA